ncbi:glycoside hydrolase family 2 protein [Lutibacter citreus]|uniref:glycoside hydrolase family 2 protein n=1 Tax=Lutibacter citreus TaxID=2138210 RepID=UPI000DBE732D|nr:glycoside hydrolase family 2 TIM barrel-domain containing protein [Lutibacter citreus]
MKRKLIGILLLFMVGSLAHAQLPEGYPLTNRTKQNINLDWKFSKMSKTEKPTAINFDDSSWKKVCIPHNPDPVSLMIDSVTHNWIQETYLRDHNWYRKQLLIQLKKNEKAFIEFEGVHNATELWVNGKFVGRYAVNGYTPHHFDITDFVLPGKINNITVLADNSFNPIIAPDPDETDYVKWAGIYRDVYLVKTNKLHVNFNWEDFDAGVHITTPTVKKRNGTVSVKTTVVNEHSNQADCRIETMIVDAEGYVLKKLKTSSIISSGHQKTFRQSTELTNNYNLWSPNSPYLYRAVSIIYLNNEAVDFVENKFGFRSIELIDGQGLLLNGEPFFMVGVNRHQSYPHIGDAVPNTLHYEAALRYKEAGINAIRTSHYTQDDAFIQACDELGMVVMEEPSTWVQWQQGAWMNNLEQASRVMVRNHRNHPSIIIWGAGINHRGPVPQLNSAIKEEDPFRLTASASSAWCGIKNAGVTDIYATMDYRRTDWPEGDFCMVMENGFSRNGLNQQFHISRYKKRKNNIGALLWVGADYNRLRPTPKEHDMITEYGLQTAYRMPRPAYYWYQSENSQLPFVHIADESVYKNEKIHIYSNAPKVALYANDKLVAIQSPDNDPLRILNNHPSFTFRYNWTNEKLTAKAIYGNKEEISHSRTKTLTPYALKLSIDNPNIPLQAGGSDLKMIRAYIVDKNGEVITDATNKVHFEVKGEGEILYANEKYIKNMQAYHGVASVYLQGSINAGEIKIKATSGKIKSGTLTIKTDAFNSDAISYNGNPIYDYPIHKIDIQAKDQLLQFGWEEQVSTNEDELVFTLDQNIHFTIKADEKLLKSKGKPAIMGDLAYMAADGIYVEKGHIYMTITNLPKGKYELKTYHHNTMGDRKYFQTNFIVKQEDTNGKKEYVADDVIAIYSDGKDMGERKPMSVTHFLESNGKQAINLSFRIDKEVGITWLNGMEFKQIK